MLFLLCIVIAIILVQSLGYVASIATKIMSFMAGLILFILLFVFTISGVLIESTSQKKPMISDLPQSDTISISKRPSDLESLAEKIIPEQEPPVVQTPANKTIYVNQEPQRKIKKVTVALNSPTRRQVYRSATTPVTAYEPKAETQTHYFLLESTFGEKDNAVRRLDFLRSLGFTHAHLIYLPHFESRVSDDKPLFAVMLSQGIATFSAAEVELQRFQAAAQQRAIEFKSKHNIIKLTTK